MIVYNVKRKWFPMKGDAETYRKSEGLPPDATTKIDVRDRDQLAALLNGLCEPPAKGETPANFPAPEKVIDDAYVMPDKDIPPFLRESWARVLGGKLSD